LFGFQGRDAIFQFLQGSDDQGQELAGGSFQSGTVFVADDQAVQPLFHGAVVEHLFQFLGYETGFSLSDFGSITHVPGKCDWSDLAQEVHAGVESGDIALVSGIT